MSHRAEPAGRSILAVMGAITTLPVPALLAPPIAGWNCGIAIAARELGHTRSVRPA